ncbi:MAG: DUF58 domain-containing protein [Candidatus Dormibacteria bacterium]
MRLPRPAALRWRRLLARRLPDAARRATGLTGTGAALLLIAVVLWIIARLVAGRPLFLLSYGTVAIVLMAWISAGRGLRLLGRRSELAERVDEGELLQVSLAVEARRRVSTIVIEERVPESLGQTVKMAFEEIGRGTTTCDYQLPCWRRGAFVVGPLVARYGDPVGLVSRERVIAEPYEVLVHPTLGPIRDRPLTRQFEDPPMRPRSSKPWPTGLEFYGMREIRSGDDLRRIVWRAFARTGRLLVREAEQGVTDRVTLMVNNWVDAYPPGEDYSPGFEVAVRVTASLGVRHLAEGYTVTLESNGSSLTAGALRGPAARVHLLDALARVERGGAPLSAVIARLIQRRERDVHNVLVTPRLDRGEAAQLKLILATGVSILVVVVKYGDRYEEAAHNAAALGCQVIEASPTGSIDREMVSELGGRHAVLPP